MPTTLIGIGLSMGLTSEQASSNGTCAQVDRTPGVSGEMQ